MSENEIERPGYLEDLSRSRKDAQVFNIFFNLAPDQRPFEKSLIVLSCLREMQNLYIGGKSKDFVTLDMFLSRMDELIETHVKAVEKSGKREKTFFNVLYFAGNKCRDFGDYIRADRWFKMALEAGEGLAFDSVYQCMFEAACLWEDLQRFSDAEEMLRKLKAFRCRIGDISLTPKVLFRLARVLFVRGEFSEAMGVAFECLVHPKLEASQRYRVLSMIFEAFGGIWGVMTSKKLPFLKKVVCLGGFSSLILAKAPFLGAAFGRWTDRALVGFLFLINQRRKPGLKHKHILITRGMGGLGDLLMMTPGLRRLRRKYPEARIEFACPKAFHPLFSGNSDFVLLDIQKLDIVPDNDETIVVNFSDCPASWVESRTSPKVKKTRIEIFSRAMGAGYPVDPKPVYKISPEEKEFASMFIGEKDLGRRRLIGIQYKSAEPYRDYPWLDEVIEKLAAEPDVDVLVFHSESLGHLSESGAVLVDDLPLRKAVAVLEKCDLLIAPDSSFVHLAGALDIPTIALFGPIDGEVRCRHYPRCKVIQIDAGCVPCWRNQDDICCLTGNKESACMAAIGVESVLSAVNGMLSDKDGSAAKPGVVSLSGRCLGHGEAC